MATVAATRPAVHLREMSFDDHDQVTALTARYGLGRRSADEWRHVWLGNPEYREGWPLGWVLENAKGRVVGSFSNVPLAYEFEGRRLRAVTGRAWVVDADYRAWAMLLLDEFFQQPNVDLFLNTTVNKLALPAYRMFDSPPVPAGRWDESAFWITNYTGFARSAIAARGWKVPAFAAGLALRARDIVRGANRVKQSRDYEVRLHSGFDDGFDAFWQALREKRRSLVLAVRSRAALEWHFRYHLERGNVRIVTASCDGCMVAYSIFYRKDKSDYGLKRMRIVDYQHLEDDEATFAPMLARMLAECRRERVHMLEDLGCSISAVVAPHHRKLPSWLFHYKASAALSERLNNPAVWRPTLFDGDSSL